MKIATRNILFLSVMLAALSLPCHGYTVRYPSKSFSAASQNIRSAETTSTSMMMSAEDTQDPTTFREAEVLGLRLMQEGNFKEALVAFQKGMKLPGSRPDILRTKSLSGPSPVGGAFGGTDSQNVMTLDDFELQAAHYNMACAHARLGNLDDAIANLAKAFENGFDNYSTVRGDPDLDPIKRESDFI
eukprot:CAMPEP_0170301634 /NCGR_PEP_ID=MMETSP0116_2-20130129/51082_1 /TAXON_ID=400756 /ORGANISM="Durinskia baltica, Strain CSIRO CS-38" /LENGTH=186 /DNA_ID=CAMNT_0010553467 /DNA_START=229 /DNA_END=786 /DNA_ORIENTATION=-